MTRRPLIATLVFLGMLAFATGAFAAPPYPATFKLQSPRLTCESSVDNAVQLGSRRHIYELDARSGESLTLTLAFTTEDSLGRGAELWVYDPSGNEIAHVLSWDDESVSAEVAFATNGTHLVYISHADFWGLETIYPYHLAALCGPLCAGVIAEYAVSPQGWETVDFYFARNFEAGRLEDAWTWWPADQDPSRFVVVEHRVDPGPCPEVVDSACASSDRTVCGASNVWGGFYANACEFRTAVNEAVGTAYDFGAFGYYAEAYLDEDGHCILY